MEKYHPEERVKSSWFMHMHYQKLELGSSLFGCFPPPCEEVLYMAA